MERKVRARANPEGSGNIIISASGNEGIEIAFDVLEGTEFPNGITWVGWLTQKTAKRVAESLRACGWVGSGINDMTGLGTKDVNLVIDEEEYKGKVTTRVKWVNALSVKATAEQKQTAAAKFSAMLKAAEAQDVAPSTANDPDLPF